MCVCVRVSVRVCVCVSPDIFVDVVIGKSMMKDLDSADYLTGSEMSSYLHTTYSQNNIYIYIYICALVWCMYMFL